MIRWLGGKFIPRVCPSRMALDSPAYGNAELYPTVSERKSTRRGGHAIAFHCGNLHSVAQSAYRPCVSQAHMRGNRCSVLIKCPRRSPARGGGRAHCATSAWTEK
jgi:hypothetical protein